jgi:protein-disulfide isomerase
MRVNWRSAGNHLANGLVIVAVIIVLGHPRGPLVPQVREWWQNRETRALIAESWQELSAVGEGRAVQQNTGSVVVVFSDYECPACRQAELRLPELIKDSDIRIIYRHLPISQIHPAAEGAARAAICADQQDRFTAMHDLLFKTDEWRSSQEWSAAALNAGIPDTPRFLSCLESHSTTTRLQQDLEHAAMLRVNATPTFVGAGGMHVGLPSVEKLRAITKG